MASMLEEVCTKSQIALLHIDSAAKTVLESSRSIIIGMTNQNFIQRTMEAYLNASTAVTNRGPENTPKDNLHFEDWLTYLLPDETKRYEGSFEALQRHIRMRSFATPPWLAGQVHSCAKISIGLKEKAWTFESDKFFTVNQVKLPRTPDRPIYVEKIAVRYLVCPSQRE